MGMGYYPLEPLRAFDLDLSRCPIDLAITSLDKRAASLEGSLGGSLEGSLGRARCGVSKGYVRGCTTMFGGG